MGFLSFAALHGLLVVLFACKKEREYEKKVADYESAQSISCFPSFSGYLSFSGLLKIQISCVLLLQLIQFRHSRQKKCTLNV